ncbi:LacI family transcriptional regulator [Alicyclobacillaceae bacterium I2511]|nr:LacI family transcriptional regulator [Alicyclobacillaceae bacterium I2511]
MNNHRITISEVAKAAGVSITTVSRYLNQHYQAMSGETKQRIATVIAQLNYQPSPLAQGLKGNRTHTVAAVMVNLEYPFCMSIIRAMSGVLTPHRYKLMVCETLGDPTEEEKWLQTLQAHQVEGMVLQTNGANNDLLTHIAARQPVVLVDRQFDVPQAANVITNNHEASARLTLGLFQRGYARVLFVGETPGPVSTRQERLTGYLEACQQTGFEPWTVAADQPYGPACQAVVRELSRNLPTQPFAVYTANGLIMRELYPLLRQLPIDVPKQMGLATFDEPSWAHIATPSLTCVRQPTALMGELAAKAVLRQLGETEQGLAEQGDNLPVFGAVTTVPSQIVWADSTAGPTRSHSDDKISDDTL